MQALPEKEMRQIEGGLGIVGTLLRAAKEHVVEMVDEAVDSLKENSRLLNDFVEQANQR